MVDTKKRNKRQYKWQQENSERIHFIMPKGMKQQIADAAAMQNISSSEFIRNAIMEKLNRVSKDFMNPPEE